MTPWTTPSPSPRPAPNAGSGRPTTPAPRSSRPPATGSSPIGYANLSTRAVADAAEVPLSQIHYHFGSKQQLILAVLEAENERLLERQRSMYAGPEPLWRQWERACDYLDEDIESGYVRILQEMIAAGWSDAEVAAKVRDYMGGWYRPARRGRASASPRAWAAWAASRHRRSRRSWACRSSGPRR